MRILYKSVNEIVGDLNIGGYQTLENVLFPFSLIFIQTLQGDIQLSAGFHVWERAGKG